MLIYPYYLFTFVCVALAVFFLILFIKSRQSIQLICSMLWLLPIAYEAWVVSNCTGECNIRIDLLVIWPLELLLLFSISRYSWKEYKRYVGA